MTAAAAARTQPSRLASRLALRVILRRRAAARSSKLALAAGAAAEIAEALGIRLADVRVLGVADVADEGHTSLDIGLPSHYWATHEDAAAVASRLARHVGRIPGPSVALGAARLLFAAEIQILVLGEAQRSDGLNAASIWKSATLKELPMEMNAGNAASERPRETVASQVASKRRDDMAAPRLPRQVAELFAEADALAWARKKRDRCALVQGGKDDRASKVSKIQSWFRSQRGSRMSVNAIRSSPPKATGRASAKGIATDESVEKPNLRQFPAGDSAADALAYSERSVSRAEKAAAGALAASERVEAALKDVHKLLWELGVSSPGFSGMLGNVEPKTPLAPKHAKAITGFSAQAGGTGVIVSPDHLRVGRPGGQTEGKVGIVFGDGYVLTFAEGAYFEVKIEALQKETLGLGLALGISAADPRQHGRFFETLDQVPHSWAFGYDGEVSHGDWKPQCLRVGDRVGLLVTPHGEIVLYENDRAVAKVPCEAPLSGKAPLYAIFDLRGAVVDLSMVQNAKPPTPAAVLSAVIPPPRRDALRGFDAELASRCVVTSSDGLFVKRRLALGRLDSKAAAVNSKGGVIFGDGPLPVFAEGAYFEVRMEQRQSASDGLVIGVVAVDPRSFGQVFDCAEELPHAWSFGYDGQANIDGIQGSMRPITWRPHLLLVGDCVGLLVTPCGEVVVYENGAIVAQAPCRVPPKTRLFPFLELRGTAVALSLLPAAAPRPASRSPQRDVFGLPSSPHGGLSSPGERDASPPGSPRAREASPRGSSDGRDASPSFSQGSPTGWDAPPLGSPAGQDASRPLASPSPPVNAGFEFPSSLSIEAENADARPQPSMQPQPSRTDEKEIIVKDSAKVVPRLERMYAFDSECHNKYVTVSSDGLFAKRIVDDQTGMSESAVVFGNLPVPSFVEGRYFEVRLKDQRPNMNDGLAIGVTMQDPKTFREPLQPVNEVHAFRAANEVPLCWSFGYGGWAHLHGQVATPPIEWEPQNLKGGDRVGLLVTLRGEAVIYVNDIVVAAVSCRIPGDENLYAVADLRAGALSLSLVIGASPPYLPSTEELEEMYVEDTTRAGRRARKSNRGGSDEEARLEFWNEREEKTPDAREQLRRTTGLGVVLKSAEVAKRRALFHGANKFDKPTMAIVAPAAALAAAPAVATAAVLVAAQPAAPVALDAAAPARTPAVTATSPEAAEAVSPAAAPVAPPEAATAVAPEAAPAVVPAAVPAVIPVATPAGPTGAAQAAPTASAVTQAALPAALLAALPPVAPSVPAATPAVAPGAQLVASQTVAPAVLPAVAAPVVPAAIPEPMPAQIAAPMPALGPTPMSATVPGTAPSALLAAPKAPAFQASHHMRAAALTARFASAPPTKSSASSFFYFNSNILSEFVVVSADGLHARHTQPNSGAMFGVLFSKVPIPSFLQGKYFEVCLEEHLPGMEDGLVVGVTTKDPRVFGSSTFQVAEEVPSSWSFGYDGAAHIDGQEDLVDIKWQPQLCRTGDRVGLLVATGKIIIYLNDSVVEEMPCSIPGGAQLYAIVDLLGASVAVELLRDALPPGSSTIVGLPAERASAPPAQAGPRVDSSFVFDAQVVSRYVAVSEGGLHARHTQPDGAVMCGVIFGTGPVPSFPEGRYFEVRLEEQQPGMEDGLVIGVTTAVPRALDVTYEVAEGVPSSWSFGYDGQAHLDGEDDMQPIGFEPQLLRAGDRVGLLVDPRGEAVVYVNGSIVATVPCRIPASVAVYPIVDLLGAAVAVSLVATATPPPGLDLPAVFTLVANSKFVTIGEDGCQARHTQPGGEVMCGVVFGSGPLKSFPQGKYFEVQVDEQTAGMDDGLVVGVTAADPGVMQDTFEVAESVPSSWSLGYDGSAHVDGQDEMMSINWKPQDLRAGDRVGLLINQRGEANVYKNGTVVARVACRIPAERELTALIDLLGGTVAVSLLPRAVPPPHL